MPRAIARLRRPPYNKSTQEIGDLTPRQIADIFSPDPGESDQFLASHLGGSNLSKIPAAFRPTIR